MTWYLRLKAWLSRFFPSHELLYINGFAGCETANVNAVMDGALDPFINAYLACAATGNWVTK